MIEVIPITTPNSAISHQSPVVFDIRTDNPNLFTSVMVGIWYEGANTQEFAYAQDPASATGTVFFPYYSVGSTMVQTSDPGFQRYRYTLIRNTSAGALAWPAAPKLVIYAYNDAGEEL